MSKTIPNVTDKILYFVKEFIDENSISPTVREISAGTGICKTTVNKYLMQMRETGVLDYRGKRGIKTKEQIMTNRKKKKVPVLGSVACGLPKFAEENIEEYVELPISIFGEGNFFLLHADGDSMINAGIDDGDLILIRQQNTAEPGQIVIALIGDTTTLKRFYPENNQIRLHPENNEFDDIYVDNCIIQGIAVKVIKDL